MQYARAVNSLNITLSMFQRLLDLRSGCKPKWERERGGGREKLNENIEYLFWDDASAALRAHDKH